MPDRVICPLLRQLRRSCADVSRAQKIFLNTAGGTRRFSLLRRSRFQRNLRFRDNESVATCGQKRGGIIHHFQKRLPARQLNEGGNLAPLWLMESSRRSVS
jgi:hypothetical protein